tara:strand:- start:7579 stop:7776 length:198 start_codon:yes stop_codon:yes gene_type:complete
MIDARCRVFYAVWPWHQGRPVAFGEMVLGYDPDGSVNLNPWYRMFDRCFHGYGFAEVLKVIPHGH